MNRLKNIHSRLALLGATTAIALAVACGGSGSSSSDTPSGTAASDASTATTAPTMAATEAATSAPTTAATAEATTGGDEAEPSQFEIGREIFNKTAGGVGCAFCHGADGKGDGPAMLGAPANRGATEQLVREKLAGVPDMSGIKLTDAEIDAVVVYLAYLAEQP